MEGIPLVEVIDEVESFVSVCRHTDAIDGEEGVRDSKGDALVAVDKRMALGNALS